jgi:hypothetical protein
LPEFTADPPKQSTELNKTITQQHANPPLSIPNHQKHKAHRKFLERQLKRDQRNQQATADDEFFDHHIQWAEYERTAMEKATPSRGQFAVNTIHNILAREPISILQNGSNKSYALATSIRRAFHRLQQANHVNFANNNEIKYYDPSDNTPLITYDSGADRHYLNKQDSIDAGLPILRKSSKRVGVANGGTSKADNVTALPFDHFSPQAHQADTFTDFPQSLMSVGKVSDDGIVSIFTKEGVTVHKEEDVLITCKGDSPFSLACVRSTAGIASHSHNTKASGSLASQPNGLKLSFNKPTASTTYQVPSRQSSGCTQCATIQSSQLG